MEQPPLTLSCALVQLGGARDVRDNGEAAVATAGGVFAVSLDPRRLVSELKEAIKRKKPHDLRHVDADALSLYLATDGDGSQWLSDEHDAALSLEIRGSPVHEVVIEMLMRPGGMLRATKPLHRYFLGGSLPPPGPEQIHLLVMVPAIPIGKRKMRAQEAASKRAAKAEQQHGYDDDVYADIVRVMDSDEEGANDYPEPPKPLNNVEELYQRMGKEYVSSASPLLQRGPSATDQERPGPVLEMASSSRPSRMMLPEQVLALLHSRYIHRPTNSTPNTSAFSSRSAVPKSIVSPSTADGSSADRAIELMEADSISSASHPTGSTSQSIRGAIGGNTSRLSVRPSGDIQSRFMSAFKSIGAANTSPLQHQTSPPSSTNQPSNSFAPSRLNGQPEDVKPDLSTPTGWNGSGGSNSIATTAAMFERLSQFDSEPNTPNTVGRGYANQASQSPGPFSPSQPTPSQPTPPQPTQSQATPSQGMPSQSEEIPSLPPEPPIVFSEEQNKFINLAVEKRRNLLLVAPAGYGKSAVIKTIIQLFNSSLPSVNDQPVCGLCAPTGKAASLIGGRTLHSYLGIGLGRGSVSDWVKRVRSASFLKPTLKALRAVRVILIDEISMVSAQFLDRISKYLQEIRGNTRPFGGVQMILVGDLCQLPPVEGAFMFRSLEYARAEFQSYQFTKCFRQDDPEFVALLNEVRFARCSEQTMSTLRKCMSIAPEYANGLTPMRIVSTNKEVDAINERELLALTHDSKAEVITYNVCVSQFANPKKAEAYRKADGIPEYVKLAIGCHVVVTQNLGQGIVNGTQGCITAVDSKKIELRLQDGNTATIEYFAYKDPEQPDVFLANTLFSYMPVRLGYASTVHKAQGMTLQLLEVDLKRVFAHGQLYTALSRVTDLRGLIVKNLTERAFICSEVVHEFYRKLGKGGDVVEVSA